MGVLALFNTKWSAVGVLFTLLSNVVPWPISLLNRSQLFEWPAWWLRMASIEKLVKSLEALKVIHAPVDKPEEPVASTKFAWVSRRYNFICHNLTN